jgi:outer membrane receptor protein involved in Fe transport
MKIAFLLVFLSVFGAMAPRAAVAQQAHAPGREVSKRDSLPVVTVRGYSDPGSIRNAIRLQQAAGPIVDIVPEESIERTSDLSIADVARRVNGLSVTMDNTGASDRTIIRGMDPKYNYTLVDGVKIPSPGDRSRYIPLSIFPADIVERIEVYKNLTPDMEGDAIGGVVNLAMRKAPENPLFKVRLTSGYNQTFFDQSYLSFDNHVINQKSPYELHGSSYQATGSDFTKANLYFRDTHPAPDMLGSVTWGRRFLRQKAGLLLAADYQDIKRGSSDFFIPQNNQPQENNAPGLTDFYLNRYSTTLIREGLHSHLDYTFNTRNAIHFYQFYVREQDIESRYRADTSLDLGRSIPGTGRITLSDRSREHFQSIYNASLHGDHHLNSRLSIQWTTAWSTATGLYPDWSELSAGTARIQQPNGSVAQSPLLLEPLTRIWLRNRERDLSGYFNMGYHRPVKGHELSLDAGGLYRRKDRDNFYNSYTFQPAITGSQGQPFSSIYAAQWTNNDGPQNPLGAVSNPNTYTAQEDIGAGYLSLGWKGPKADWIAGLRYENTHQDFVSSVDPTVSYGKTGSIRYFDYLPSVQVKYRLTDRQLLRASWYQSLSRPALYDVTFYSIQYEDYQEVGNPYLQRARADNFDLRYEWYPGGLDLLQAGVFYKHIADPYERTLLDAGDELYPIPSQGLSYTPAGQLTAQERNASDANDYGLELAGTKYFGRLGIQAAYTYTYSRIVQPTKFETRQDPADPSGNLITVTRTESRPLQGQSPHLANLSLLYQDIRHGWNARVSGIYTGRRIYSVSGWWGLDYWERGYTVLDLGVEKTWGRHVKVFAKASNLFSTITTVDLLKANPSYASALIPGQQRSDRITVMSQTDRPAYYLGFQWAL